MWGLGCGWGRDRGEGGGGGGGGVVGGGGDLPYPVTGRPVPGVGCDFFIDLYQMLDMLDTLWIYYTDVSAITHYPRVFLPSDVLREHRNGIGAIQLPCVILASELGYSVGVFQALWLAVLAIFGVVD